MSRLNWSRLKGNAVATLTNACELLSRRPSECEALATLVASAEVNLTVRIRDGRIEPAIETSPTLKDDTLAQQLLNLIAGVATGHVSSSRPDMAPAFGGWVEEHGFSTMIVALLGSDVDRTELGAVADIVKAAIQTLSERSKAIALSHMQDILERDLPQALFLRHQLTSAAVWLLAPSTSGAPNRAEVLKRRLQAMSIYGALSGTLYEPDISRAIDEGMPLAPLLMQRHDLSAAELRAVRQARRLRHSIENPGDFRIALEELKAHEVPLHEWPGGGRPGQPDAWEPSIWHKGARQNFVRPDYGWINEAGVQDVINALRDDLLRPLVAERIRLGGFAYTYQIQNFARSVTIDGTRGGGEPRRHLLAAFRHAIVGTRRPKAFHEAIGQWHRRVASLSALRHERRADRPGWPALCAPWQSPCGRFQIVALTSAAGLVEEGQLLDHCVGVLVFTRN